MNKDIGDRHQTEAKADTKVNDNKANTRIETSGDTYQAKTKAGNEDKSGDEGDFFQAGTKAEP